MVDLDNLKYQGFFLLFKFKVEPNFNSYPLGGEKLNLIVLGAICNQGGRNYVLQILKLKLRITLAEIFFQIAPSLFAIPLSHPLTQCRVREPVYLKFLVHNGSRSGYLKDFPVCANFTQLLTNLKKTYPMGS